MKYFIILIILSCSKLSFGQISDTMALNMNQFGNCGTANYNLIYYFENVDTVVFHIDFGNNTDTIFTGPSTGYYYPYNSFSSGYAYSGNYTVQVTAETTSGTFLDQQTYNYVITGGEGCSLETINNLRNDFSGSWFNFFDSLPIDFTGADGITQIIFPTTIGYPTNTFLYPAQVTANPAWLAAHNLTQLSPPILFSAPNTVIPGDMHYGLGYASFIIARTDVVNVNNKMSLAGNSLIANQQPTDCYLHLNNTIDAIPDSLKRIRVEYDPFLNVSHDTLLNMTEGTGFIEFDVELLNLYESIHFSLTASSVVSLDSIYFRCFYLNNIDQNAQDDTTTLFLTSVNPCDGMTDSVLNISLNSTLSGYVNNQVISQLTLSKTMCEEVDSIGLTVYYSPFMELDQPNSNLQFSQINDSTLYTIVTIPQYAFSQYYPLPFLLAATPPGSVYVNYTIDILDFELQDNTTGDTLNFVLCDSLDLTISAISANMIAPTQSGTCSISPFILSSCVLADSAELLITFPSYVMPDSNSLALGTFIDSTLHILVDWTNQNDYHLINFHIPGTIPSGTPYTITAKIVNSNDPDTANNELSTYGNVLNSYDPNEKHADLPSLLNPDIREKITYTIHFQNDGNLEAYNIVVRDTLSANLDINTFEFLGASHHCEVYIDSSTREITFNFSNIMLPFSESDSLGSQGIFSYRISENTNLPLGSIIENTAYIYFDFNPAIITNTTYNINELPLGLDEPISEAIYLYPNPAEDKIKFSGASVTEASIYDLTGKLVLETKNILNNELSLNNLQTGIYQAVLKTNSTISTQKLVIKK
jgi:uncharacterized repeat protein (TIGR01451 family)